MRRLILAVLAVGMMGCGCKAHEHIFEKYNQFYPYRIEWCKCGQYVYYKQLPMTFRYQFGKTRTEFVDIDVNGFDGAYMEIR